MANPTPSQQIPQHVAALLSHLTSRPGVQSTFILSRKDGSIIQSTGLLASSSSPSSSKHTRNGTSSPAPVGTIPEESFSAASTTSSATDIPSTSITTGTPTPQKPYQPSQAEALAAHIFAFVSSASILSLSLSHPPGEGPAPAYPSLPPPPSISSPKNGGSEAIPSNNGVDGEGEGSDREDDDEVKLLRLRTKKHEIVVVPDRKYLLCVVHDAAHPVANPGAGSGVRLSR